MTGLKNEEQQHGFEEQIEDGEWMERPRALDTPQTQWRRYSLRLAQHRRTWVPDCEARGLFGPGASGMGR